MTQTNTDTLNTRYTAAREALEAAQAEFAAAKAEFELAHGPAWQAELLDGVTEARATTLRIAFEAGADEATCRAIADAARVSRSGPIAVRTRYGGLSRGKAWGRDKEDTTWADKEGGTVLLTAGSWRVGSSDGFSRKESPVTWDVTSVEVGDQTWLIAN